MVINGRRKLNEVYYFITFSNLIEWCGNLLHLKIQHSFHTFDSRSRLKRISNEVCISSNGNILIIENKRKIQTIIYLIDFKQENSLNFIGIEIETSSGINQS